MEDSAIIALYWDRDETAITATGEKYGAYCYAIAYHILKSPEDSDECVNDTWFRAWNAMPPQKPRVLSAFLGRITRNLSIDRYRQLHAAKRAGELEAVDLELDGCAPAFWADERIDAIATGEAISRFLRAISRDDRVIFLRRYWYVDSIAEIAARYRVSESRVKSSLHRSRARLRKYLEQEGVAP